MYVHPKTSVRRKMQDSQCQMTYDDETEVASRSKRRGEIKEWGPANDIQKELTGVSMLPSASFRAWCCCIDLWEAGPGSD